MTINQPDGQHLIISTLRVRNFRRLHSFDVELRPLTVMVGSNGVGKTTVLDALKITAASAAGALETTMKANGGIWACRTIGSMGDVMFEVLIPGDPGWSTNYSIRLAHMGYGGYLISGEVLQLNQDGQQRGALIQSTLGDVRYFDPDTQKSVLPTTVEALALTGVSGYAAPGESSLKYNPAETALSQAPMNIPLLGVMRGRIASLTHYSLLDLRLNAPIRMPQSLRPAHLPGPNGEDLLSCLYTMKEQMSDLFQAVEDAIRAGFPEFEKFEFPPLAQGIIGLGWKDRRYPAALFMNQLSDGMLRFLWLVTLLYSPGLGEVTLIDEPEVSLHPELLRILAELLREASLRTQLIVATHSDRLVGFLKPEELLVLDSGKDGNASARWGDSFDAEKWLDEYTLGDVWRMGQLGGRTE